MSDVAALLDSALLLGLCYGGVAFSIVISLRFLNFPDLTVEGSVPLGGAIGSVTLVSTGSLPLAFAATLVSGALAGCVTSTIHVALGVGKLLSGILVLSMLYSVTLRVLGGSNVSLLGTDNLFTEIEALDRSFASGDFDPTKIAFLAVIMGACTIGSYRFFESSRGIAIRSIGDNERALVNLGRDPRPYKFVALALANAIAALAGLLVSLNQGFADVGMGQGGLVLGLAGLILGEQTIARVIGPRHLVVALLSAALVGSVLYQVALLLALKAGIAPSDLKLLTALIVLGAMVMTRGKSPFYEERTF